MSQFYIEFYLITSNKKVNYSFNIVRDDAADVDIYTKEATSRILRRSKYAKGNIIDGSIIIIPIFITDQLAVLRDVLHFAFDIDKEGSFDQKIEDIFKSYYVEKIPPNIITSPHAKALYKLLIKEFDSIIRTIDVHLKKNNIDTEFERFYFVA